MSTPNEYTDNLKSNLICIFLSVGTKSKKTLCPRTQCKIFTPSMKFQKSKISTTFFKLPTI